MRQPGRPHSTVAARELTEQQRQAAIDRVVRLLVTAHAAASSTVAWWPKELEPPPELPATVSLLLVEIETRMLLGRKAQRANLERIADLGHQFTAALSNPDVAQDLYGPDGLLAATTPGAPGIRIEDIEQIARRADRKASRIPDGRGAVTMADVEGRPSAQLVCAAAAVWLFERATGRHPGGANSTLAELLDCLWIGAGGKPPSVSHWDRSVAIVLNPDSQQAAGKSPAALVEAKLAIRDAGRLGGLLRLEKTPTRRISRHRDRIGKNNPISVPAITASD
jgi:hypothetical protein